MEMTMMHLNMRFSRMTMPSDGKLPQHAAAICLKPNEPCDAMKNASTTPIDTWMHSFGMVSLQEELRHGIHLMGNNPP